MRKRFTELKGLIKKAITDLGKLDQTKLLCDVFDTYFLEHVIKYRSNAAEVKEVEDEFLFEICQLINQYGEPIRVAQILEQVSTQCVSEDFIPFNQKICHMIGLIHQKNALYSKAYTYFLRANALKETIACMKVVMKNAYKSEIDLFPARLCLEVLIRNRKDGLLQVEEILREFPDKTPLSNFLLLVLEAIKMKDFNFYKMLIGTYKDQIYRDS